MKRMRDLAKRGGAATKAKALRDPGYYREIGAMGGRASRGTPKTTRRRALVVPAPSGRLVITRERMLLIADELDAE